ncbi:hypothetical protein ACIBLA_32720 [Streptomyces sp. NPDC050433]|uniref:hypothetical protein n=1 Tax=unclassified Streptomyces TaxID=2593676 RepID=UPI00342CF5F1
MRQLSAPGRFAVWIVTSVAVATSTGCMSVGHDEGKPAPSRSAEREGAVAEPDGGTAADAGAGLPADGRGGARREDAGHPGEHGEKGEPAGPEASGAPSAKPSKGPDGKPLPPAPRPPGGDVPPAEQPTRTPPPSEPPPPDPEPEPPAQPEPSGPPEPPPSATPTADVRTSARAPGDGAGMRKEPAASPQLGPL